MNELVALQVAQDGKPVSYSVKQDGKIVSDAVLLTAGAVHAFFEHVRKQQPGIADAAISILLSQHLSGRVQTYDFLQYPPVHIDAAEMLMQIGGNFNVIWDRQLEIETPYTEGGAPLAAVQYATRIKAAGEERNIKVRVPYVAYIDLKERVSDPWERLKVGVAKAFEARLHRPRFVPRQGEIVELSSDEVLS